MTPLVYQPSEIPCRTPFERTVRDFSFPSRYVSVIIPVNGVGWSFQYERPSRRVSSLAGTSLRAGIGGVRSEKTIAPSAKAARIAADIPIKNGRRCFMQCD